MDTRITRDQPEFRNVTAAFILIGLASFNIMYATQGLIPVLHTEFDISPQLAATTVGATTGTLAVSILPMSILSERFGRGRIMMWSLIGAFTLGIAIPFAPTIEILIVLRALQGLAIAGVPATAMAWLSDEVHPFDLTRIMGYYIAGTTVGGLLGRIIPTSMLSVVDWRVALGVNIAVVGALATLAIWLMPAQKHFHAKPLAFLSEFRAIATHLKNPNLLGCFALAFLLMGSFVSLYNYLGIRLINTFDFSPTLAGAVFVIYLVGTFTAAEAGALASKIGRKNATLLSLGFMAAGFALLMMTNLATTLIGTALMTGGFFIAHSLASAWVGALARENKAEASGTYLASYYLGSSVIGTATGVVLDHGTWIILCLVLLGLVAISTLIAAFMKDA